MTTNSTTAPALPRSLFVFALLYGGMTVLAGVLGNKQVSLPGGLAVEAGIFAFLMLVVLSSSVAQLYGKKFADRMVMWGFLPLAISIGIIGLVLVLPASSDMPGDRLAAFDTIMKSTPRIMAAGPVAYGVSLFLNVYLFDKLKPKEGESGTIGLMVRGAVASAISQAIDSVIFITLAFAGEFPIMPLLIGQIIAKVALSIVLVPFLITGAVALGRKLDEKPLV